MALFQRFISSSYLYCLELSKSIIQKLFSLAMLGSRRGSRASIVNVFTYSTIFEDEEGAGEEVHKGVLLKTDLNDCLLLDKDIDYSVSEISESFTIVQTGEEVKLLSVLAGVTSLNKGEEDTDVEEDDEFDEYSEVTFEQPKPVVSNARVRKNTVYENMALIQKKPNNSNNTEKHNHGSLCHCAETYRSSFIRFPSTLLSLQ